VFACRTPSFPIESDPRTLTAEMAARIGALGFTRASFGVQEFDPRVQAAINRVQPPEMVARAVDRLRAAGVGRINFDLIYGLPHQTVETLLATIADRGGDGQPDRVALFGYAHVPWIGQEATADPDETVLPGGAERGRQAEAAAAALAARGLRGDRAGSLSHGQTTRMAVAAPGRARCGGTSRATPPTPQRR
jgi:oxygen-independent coproporphyrinogen-3 oxidase